MKDIKRRQFMRLGFAFSSVPLAACGGGAGAAAVAARALPAASPSPAPAPTPVPTGSMAFSLSSSVAVASAPFCIGFAFKQGDVPAGQGVVGNIVNLQVVPKNRWPDGSLKFAVVAGRADIAAGQPLTVSLAAGTSTGGTALALTDLKATNLAASVGCGSFGTVSWSGADWDAPFQSWISGPQMSSWVYRKAVGTDAHLVAWLEVRLFAGGAVEVLPWIENGFLKVVGPTNKSATYTFALGGSQRFSAAIDLPHHCRTPLVSGAVLSHWLGADPAVTPRHDTLYMQFTELVPSYRGMVPASATAVSNLPGSYVPLQQGGYSNAMGQTGYQPAIGLLPLWDVLYLTCPASSKPFEALQRNAYSAGRYPIHYRDETTNRPLRFSSYPNLSLTSSSLNQYPPTPSGTAPQTWDVSHHPSLGFMAYLVTGRWYFMEQLQFAATANYLHQVDIYRKFAGGVFLSSSGSSTTRGAAWSVRTIAQAAVATPDDDLPLRSEMLASFAANVDFNHSTYVAQPNNPFGIVAPYGDAYGTPTDGKVTEATWQQDFYTAAFGYALAMQPAIAASEVTKLAAFFAWKAQSIIGRLGGTTPTEWLYRDAAPYNFVVAPVDFPDWAGGTGPWFADWGAMYQATFGTANPGTPGDLRGAYFPNTTSYWGNLQPAIAYAVRHNAPGAVAAYRRMTSAANWPQFVDGFNTDAVWGVRPIKEP